MPANLIRYAIPGFIMLITAEVIFTAVQKKDFYESSDAVGSISIGLGKCDSIPHLRNRMTAEPLVPEIPTLLPILENKFGYYENYRTFVYENIRKLIIEQFLVVIYEQQIHQANGK